MTVDLPEDTMTAVGWEDALAGVGWRLNTPIAVYDRDKVMELLMSRDGLSEEDADEYISFNIEGAYMGEGTPLFVRLHKDEADAEALEYIRLWGKACRDRDEARDTACRLEEEVARLRQHIEGLEAP